jgi:hypothetical protein
MMQYSTTKVIGIATLIVLLAVSICHAEKRYDEQGDEVAYGSLFHTGKLDGVDEGQEAVYISVDDMGYQIGPDALLRNANRSIIPYNRFELGDTVKFYAIDRVISKMWISDQDDGQTEGEIVKEGSDQDSQETGQSTGGETGEFRLENGVWTN